MFKHTIVGFAVLLVVVKAQGPPLPPGFEECVKELGSKLAEGDKKFYPPPTVMTDGVSCLMGCMARKNQIMNPDFTINADKVLEGHKSVTQKVAQMLPANLPSPPPGLPTPPSIEKMKAGYEMCADKLKETKAANECEAAKTFAECMKSQNLPFVFHELKERS